MEDGSQDTFGRRDVRELLEDTYAIYGKNFLVLLAITATLYALYSGIAIVADLGLGYSAGMATPTYDIAAAISTISAGLAYIWIVMLASTILIPVADGALICGTAQYAMSGKIEYGRAYKQALRRYGTLVLTTLLQGLALLLLTITVIGIPAAIYFAVRWAFVYQAVVIEGYGVAEAFSRSSALVKTNWWRVFGLMLLWVVILVALTSAIEFPLSSQPVLSEVLLFVVNLFLMPLIIIYTTLIFVDLRGQNEEFNPEILAEEMGMTEEYNEYLREDPEVNEVFP
jgi:hypothetical protein